MTRSYEKNPRKTLKRQVVEIDTLRGQLFVDAWHVSDGVTIPQ